MIKCIHKTCKWPECDKTCGKVPKGDYIIGSSTEEKLIYYLQDQIEKLSKKNKEMFNTIQLLRSNLTTYIQKPLGQIANELSLEYERVCPFGKIDCVYDPGYIRHYYPDWWKELGMPTTCSHVITDTDGNQYCTSYDDEDK